ncbi:MAG: alpha/beta hydrolase [Myxococcota bacterium]|nr:alpha/beta hydrolase [Myxococcota bacterium]
MASLLTSAFGLFLRAPGWLLVRLSGRPRDRRGHRELLPAFQFMCSVLARVLPPIETLSAPEMRKQQDDSPLDFDPLPRDAGPTQDHAVSVDGGEILVREYTPSGASGVLPTLVYFHGGGWVLGNVEGHNTLCARLAAGSGCRVFSVDYRLAPEYPFPVPLQDCEAAFDWVRSNAERLNVDPSRIAAGGDSAGGNLTAALCISRVGSGKPLPCLQLLVYPCTDFAFATKSFDECGDGFFLTRGMMEWFRGHYLPDPDDWTNPLASPMQAEDLSGHPPAILVTAGFDPLCDEGEAYGDRLESAGLAVARRTYDPLIHGFANMGLIPEARAATEEIANLLSEKLR